MVAASHLAREMFGRLPDGRAVERVTLRGMHGFEAHIITYGATLQALFVPDAEGRCEDVVLGHADLAGHLGMRKFFGATVGRYANRIANARFVLDGAEVRLAANNGPHALHGGLEGFDRKLWQIVEIEDGAEPMVTLAYGSADGEESYPGRLDVRLTYRLIGPAELSLTFTAKADRPTICNLTNHTFFNLDGASVRRKYPRSSADDRRRPFPRDRSHCDSAAGAAAGRRGHALRFPHRHSDRRPHPQRRRAATARPRV